MIKKETIKNQIENLRNLLLENKEKIEKKEISYEDILTILKSTFHLNINKKTLKSYCENHLHFK